MKILVSLSVAGLLLLASCGGKGKDAASMSYSQEDANEVIAYYNITVDLMKKLVTTDDISKTLAYMKKDGKGFVIAPIVNRSYFQGKDTTALLNPGDCFPDVVRDSLKALCLAYVDASNKVYANYEEYCQYIKAEDYKDDQYAKGREIAADQEEQGNRIQELRARIYALVTPYADKAEEATLKDNPLKDHIMAGKALISSLEAVLEGYDSDVAKEQMQSLYDAVNTQKEAASKIEKLKEYSSEMMSYEDMVNDTDKFLGELRKHLRDGKFTESGYKELLYNYNHVIDDYNRFVN
ncbi:DUF3829 domain-containing protein [Bacteroides stercorirosoris]|uniref:DUF3829 domain-containing protein n=1 Tax=Bacteroides stercorirosoris TaxID=871324 RepID=A0A413GN12_9BACE|nr:DUF3829 domain-containing protein [Bacteroides stercorirosoris]RGX72527.1 DUF3829 domain-containing protein [Bacteroides stercorirosoris]